MPGPTELLIVLGIVLVIFGGSKLPQLARSVGKARTEFQRGIREGEGEGASSDESTDSTKGGSTS
jgi:sec-independent protein translocase protein TatA